MITFVVTMLKAFAALQAGASVSANIEIRAGWTSPSP